jgi:hypothetical protein
MTQPRGGGTESSQHSRVEPEEQACCVGDVGGGDKRQRGSGSCRRTLHLWIRYSEIIREAMQPNPLIYPASGSGER